MLYLQTQASPTRDVRVRRAIAHALDYRALSAAWRSEFRAASSFLPPPIVRWRSVAIPAYPHDLTLAGRELDSAGWTIQHGVRAKGGVAARRPHRRKLRGPDQRPDRHASAGAARRDRHADVDQGQPHPHLVQPRRPAAQREGHDRRRVVGRRQRSRTVAQPALRCRPVSGGDNHSFYCSKRFESLFDDQARTPSQDPARTATSTPCRSSSTTTSRSYRCTTRTG